MNNNHFELRPLVGTIETAFQIQALEILQKALLAAGTRIILPKAGEELEILEQAMSDIGYKYYQFVPKLD